MVEGKSGMSPVVRTVRGMGTYRTKSRGSRRRISRQSAADGGRAREREERVLQRGSTGPPRQVVSASSDEPTNADETRKVVVMEGPKWKDPP